MRTTLDLPDDLFRQAKIHAAVKGISLKELFTEALKKALVGQSVLITQNPGSSQVLPEETPSNPT